MSGRKEKEARAYSIEARRQQAAFQRRVSEAIAVNRNARRERRNQNLILASLVVGAFILLALGLHP